MSSNAAKIPQNVHEGRNQKLKTRQQPTLPLAQLCLSQSPAKPKNLPVNFRSGTDKGMDGGLTLGQNHASAKHGDSGL